MKKKNILYLVLVLVLLLGVEANAAGIKLIVNDVYLQEYPLVENSRVLLPFRTVFNSLGIDDIEWDGASRTVRAANKDRKLELTIDKKKALVDGQEIEMDQPAIIVEGRTMVPTRFVAEVFGIPVDWDPATRSVLINSAKPKNSPKQKMPGPMPQTSIDRKHYYKSFGENFPGLDEKYNGRSVLVEKDIYTKEERIMTECLDENRNIWMIVAHVDDTIWYVEEVGRDHNGFGQSNLVVYNPKTGETRKKELDGLELVKDPALKSVKKGLDKYKKKIGKNARVEYLISGSSLAHTEDYVYMEFLLNYTVLSKPEDSEYLDAWATARVRKSDLHIDFIGPYKANTIDSIELDTPYEYLGFLHIDEDYYYMYESSKDKTYRLAHNSYKREELKGLGDKPRKMYERETIESHPK